MTAPAEVCQEVTRWASLMDPTSPDDIQRVALADMQATVSTVNDAAVVDAYSQIINAWNEGTTALNRAYFEAQEQLDQQAARDADALARWNQRQTEAIMRGDYNWNAPLPDNSEFMDLQVEVAERVATVESFVISAIRMRVDEFLAYC